MHDRILIPHGRGRRPANMNAAAVAAAQQQAAAHHQQAAAAAAGISPEYYAQFAQLSANSGSEADPKVLANFHKYFGQFTAAGGSSGQAAAFSALAAATGNPVYATAMQQQFQAMMASESPSRQTPSTSSTASNEDEAAATHPAFQMANYAMLGQFYAQSSQYAAAALAAHMANGAAEKSPTKSPTSGASSSTKKQRVRDSGKASASATVTSAAANASTSSSKSSPIPEGKSSNKKPSKLENIINDLSTKKGNGLDGDESS